MASSTKMSPSLTKFPKEILLEIYHQLDAESVFSFATTHRAFSELFTSRKVSILLPILARDFSPFHELLQVYTASRADLEGSKGLYAPREIVFSRYPGDPGLVFAPCPTPVVSAPNGHAEAGQAQKKNAATPPVSRTVRLSEQDLGPLLSHCRLTRQWEERFPQMRWFHDPEDCRTLRPHEAERFRKALYRWWLYGFYFHGDFPRPRAGLPEPCVEDIRTSQMRRYSTSELLDLMDLVETMKDVVLQYLCPRLDPNQLNDPFDDPLMEVEDRASSLLTLWNDNNKWGRVVKTYAKLGPKDLLRLFENVYSYPGKRLIAEARLCQPTLAFDQASIQFAIRSALDERCWMVMMPSLAQNNVGGIIDFDDDRDKERVDLGGDARLDGTLPPGMNAVRSVSQFSPRGDDGSYLEEAMRHDWLDGRSAISMPLSPMLY